MLTTRQLNILSLLIQIYTVTGMPVGSKTLMNNGINASSATIRNDLAALEEKGLIQKTHSSSGRIPSMLGYRFYVDHLLKPASVSMDDLAVIRSAFQKDFHEINEIVEHSAKILSQLTSYTAFSLGPEMKERRLTGFRIVPLNAHQVIALMVTNVGNVESQVFSIPAMISSEDVEKMVRIINDYLVGEPLISVYYKLQTEIPYILQKHFEAPDNFIRFFDGILNKAFEKRIFVSGEMNLLDFDLLSDFHQFKSLYSIVNDEKLLGDLLTSTDHEIQIRIGNELPSDLLKNMSLITASYQVEGHGKGTIALLGPSNMSYDRLWGLLDAFRKELAKQLDDYYRSLGSSNIF